MSLKIKISKANIQATDSVPSKRRAQRVAYTDDEDGDNAADAFHDAEARPKRKKARTVSRGASADSGDVVDEDAVVDVDGDIEDTRFLPDPQPSGSRSISPANASVKLRLPGRSKEKEKAAKPSKLSKKPKRAVLSSDSEEDFNEPIAVVTSDEDFDPGVEFASNKKGSKGRSGKGGASKGNGKARAVRMEEEESDEEVVFRDERKALVSAPLDVSKRDLKDTSDPLDEPVPKRRKLPPIKKNKQPGSTSTGPSTPAAHKLLGAVASVEKKETLTPAPTSNQIGVRKPAYASTDINLLDSSVYSELFRSTPGASTPNSGLNRKQKEEERRKELNKLRAEARARREAEAKHAFDLQAGPDKVQRYEEVLRRRNSIARFPNILGASLKELLDGSKAHKRSPSSGRMPPR